MCIILFTEVITFPARDKNEFRMNKGAVEYDLKSTLHLNMTMAIEKGVLYPVITWQNPDILPQQGSDLSYVINYYLQDCDCPWPEDHYSKVLIVPTYEQVQ